MLTVQVSNVKTGPATTILSTLLTDVRSVAFSSKGVISIETEDGAVKEIDISTVATAVATVTGSDVAFEITGA